MTGEILLLHGRFHVMAFLLITLRLWSHVVPRYEMEYGVLLSKNNRISDSNVGKECIWEKNKLPAFAFTQLDAWNLRILQNVMRA